MAKVLKSQVKKMLAVYLFTACSCLSCCVDVGYSVLVPVAQALQPRARGGAVPLLLQTDAAPQAGTRATPFVGAAGTGTAAARSCSSSSSSSCSSSSESTRDEPPPCAPTGTTAPLLDENADEDDDVCVICHEEIHPDGEQDLGTYYFNNCGDPQRRHLLHWECGKNWIAEGTASEPKGCPVCNRSGIGRDYAGERRRQVLLARIARRKEKIRRLYLEQDGHSRFQDGCGLCCSLSGVSIGCMAFVCAGNSHIPCPCFGVAACLAVGLNVPNCRAEHHINRLKEKIKGKRKGLLDMEYEDCSRPRPPPVVPFLVRDTFGRRPAARPPAQQRMGMA
ncbi:unnamed protein product [Amoebophrya sp. A120]|nr:unnamed protein product [Amoebophrya sp. A120]|eukprot:GSA120T00007145001.1